LAWLPLVFHSYLHLLEQKNIRFALQAAFFAFLCLTGGYPAVMIIAFYALLPFLAQVLFRLAREKSPAEFKAFGLSHGVFLLCCLFLCGGYFYEVIQVSSRFTRSGGMDLSSVINLPFSLPSYLSLQFPYAVSVGQSEIFNSDVSMINAYGGLLLLPLLCYLFVRRQFHWMPIAIAGLLMFAIASTDLTPFRKWLYYSLPLMKLFRMPSIFRIPGLFFLIWAAAGTLHSLMHRADWRPRLKEILRFTLAFLALSFLLSALFAYTNVPAAFANRSENLVAIARLISIQSGIQFVLISILLVGLYKVSSKVRIITLLLLVMIVDLITAVQLNAESTVFDIDSRLSHLQKQLDQLPDTYAIPDLEKPMKSYSHFAANEQFKPIWFNQSILKQGYALGGHSAFVLQEAQNIYEHPQRSRLVENALLFTLLDSSKISISQFSPVSLTAKVQVAASDTLVYFQCIYPNWKSEVDGVPTSVRAHQNALVSLPVPPGESEVHLYYEHRYLRWLLMLQYLSLGLLVIFWMVRQMRGR
jgi:hypothetical protein